ncbi:MAG TPA: MlaD family protein [Verrucomicrobiae bacterium]|nr:MlaD family protein [Verrucomicrobiae bacterium]
MSQPINNFKLGLFTLCGVLLLILGILAFGARSYFVPMSRFETYIQGDVTGLAVGSAVELRGVSVGKVTGIDFSWTEYKPTQPSYIVVDFEMRNDISPGSPGAAGNELLRGAIKQGLRARVKGKGITGTSVLSLEYVNPTENPPVQVPWTPKRTYIPSAPGEFGELLASVQKTLNNVESLDFKGLNQLLLSDLKSAGSVLDNARQINFGELNTNANALLTDLQSSNTKLKALLQDTDNTVQKVNLERLTQDLDILVGQLHDVVARVEPGVASIDFHALNQTLSNARQTIHDMDDVLAQLKQYPSGFLFSKPPTPLKGVETTGTP